MTEVVLDFDWVMSVIKKTPTPERIYVGKGITLADLIEAIEHHEDWHEERWESALYDNDRRDL